MGDINVKFKIMPSSPEVSLEELKGKITSFLEEKNARGTKFEEEPIAFGLKALILYFVWPEDSELESLEKEMQNIENINSVETLDIRRAI